MFRKRKCALCGQRLDSFLRIDSAYEVDARKMGYQLKGKPETLNKREYSCPQCYGVDRDRLYALFFRRLIDVRGNRLFKNLNLLHIAPSVPLQKFIDMRLGEIQSETMDLFMEDVDYKADIQNMWQIADNSYDLWICSHVLEHVRDDRQALAELFRILKPGGVGLLLVPLDLGQEVTDEVWGLSEEENCARFGQKDHVRKYSKQDFLQRVESAGFYVTELNRDYFGNRDYRENAINKEAVLYCCSKNRYEDPAKGFLQKASLTDMDKTVFLNLYRSNDEANYYFDKVILKNGYVYIWGWFYFVGEDSKDTKIKLLIQNQRKEVKILSMTFRDREDIDDAFNESKNGDYQKSGISFEMKSPFYDDACLLFLLARNKSKATSIEIKQQ